MHRDQHFGRIAHFSESLAGHLENRQLRSGAESVLYASEKPVCASVVTFELKHDIHYMLKDLRSGYAAFLGYMSDEDDRNACLLCKSEKHCSRLLDLRNRSGRGFDIL